MFYIIDILQMCNSHEHSLIFIYIEASLHCFGIATSLNTCVSYLHLHFKFCFTKRA